MEEIDSIARQIEEIGFRCQRCGKCCRPVDRDSDIVMVSPPEIRSISYASGLTWDDIAEPYPEIIRKDENRNFTIGWCLRRRPDGCRFIHDKCCSIYEYRPWICRTYPFVLNGRQVLVGPCPGLGQKITPGEAKDIGRLLILRTIAEKNEEESIRRILRDQPIPDGILVVVDSEGISPVHRK